MINRKGGVEVVIVGDHKRIVIPFLNKVKHDPARLSGVRILHTHLEEQTLDQEDLMDMIFLRLDSMEVLTVSEEGSPRSFAWAHILPSTKQNQAYFLSPLCPWDKANFNPLVSAQNLEKELERISQSSSPVQRENTALLISIDNTSKKIQEQSLQELEELAKTAGLEVKGYFIQRVKKINPSHILGKGKLAELEVAALQQGASILVFNRELSPSQLRNLTNITERKVLDRTQLILDIFAQHAKTKAGQLQVEMAQLKYTLPRLIKQNRAFSRLAGGIGGRGPGETKLEIDRRKIRDRISKIKKDLEQIKKQRATARNLRQKSDIPTVALIGYTNVGKSTLLNTLTQSNVLVANKLFATLDPSSKKMRYPENKEIIFTDTVGFISNLPTDLKEAFSATLEELYPAHLLLHVADASHPDLEHQIQAVEHILKDLHLDEKPKLLILNKWDKLTPSQQTKLQLTYPQAIAISALKKIGLKELTETILQTLF
ncbi:MAG: GTPase HflX [Desulfonauticus sp.]|nr:GTPase HflX [Desulfonauticus sp.]